MLFPRILLLLLCLIFLLAVPSCGNEASGPPPPEATSLHLVTSPSTNPLNRVVFSVQPVLQVIDQYGNPFNEAGILVSASISSGGGSLVGTLVVPTNSTGQAAYSDLSVSGKVGPRTLTFTAGSFEPVSADISLLPGIPAMAEESGGNHQFVTAGNPVSTPPAILITDADSNPVPQIPVSFAVQAGHGSIGIPTANTDADGIASVGEWILGSTQWENTLLATAGPDGIENNPIQFSAFGFPPWQRVEVTGKQPPFATGVTYNRSRDRLTLVHNIYGIAEISPSGGTWSRLEEQPRGAGRIYVAVHDATQQILTISDSDGPWCWDYATGEWSVADQGDAPSPRMFPGMVYDSINARVLLYGGHVFGGASDPVADLFSWDGQTWTRLPDPPAGPRGGHGMTYDPETGDVYVHGGTDLGNAFGGHAAKDTWVLDRHGAWTQLSTEHPRPLAIFPMVFDETRKTLIVLGGTTVGGTGYGLSTEIWELVDGQWVLSDVPTPVGARALSTLTFSPSTDLILLYGNEAAGWNDIWSYGF